jgi:putative flippase GtrA
MKKFFAAFFDRRFLRFCVVGVVNTLFGTAVMYAVRNLMPWAALGFAEASRWPYWISSAANYILGSVLSYFLNKYFTFQARQGGWRQVLRFAANITVCYLVAYGAAKPLVRQVLEGSSVTVRDNVAMLVGMVLFTGLNYLGQRFFAFQQPENGKNAEKKQE